MICSRCLATHRRCWISAKLTTMRLLLLPCVFTALWLAVGCAKTDGDKAAAAGAVTAYHDCLRRGDVPAALDFYAPEFFARNGREAWAGRLAGALEKLGTFQRAELQRASAETQIGREGGTFLVVVYRVQYERGSAMETLRLKRLQPEGDFKIFAHEIRSDALRERS